MAPTPPGQQVTCIARVIHVEDTKIGFQIEARDAGGIIARGVHKRAVIRVHSFATQLAKRHENR
jgi:predicted thioesterase